MSATSSTEILRLSILDKLLKKYEHYLITATAAGGEIKKGMSASAVRSAIHRKNFPVPTTPVMGTRMVRLVDLAALLADPTMTFPINNEGLNELEKKGRGQRGPGKRRSPVDGKA